jgi:hypothetical protein
MRSESERGGQGSRAFQSGPRESVRPPNSIHPVCQLSALVCGTTKLGTDLRSSPYELIFWI